MRMALLGLLVTGPAQASKCLHRSPNGTLEKVPGDNGFYIRITGDPEKYEPEATYTVRLVGTRTEEMEKSFTNFVLVAENSDLQLQAQPSSAGDFQLLGDVRTRFSDHCTNTVTETSSLPKTEIQALWTAPPHGSGCITFKAMVVENRLIWSMDAGRLSLTLCEDTVEEEEENLITEPCCACTEAKYEVMFQGLWSKETHPKDFPASEWLLHFSDVIGASHSPEYRVWEAGGLASKGLSSVAKWGSPRVLESELKSKSSYIRTIIKSRGLWFPNVNGKTFAIFRTDSRNHLVSLVSMLGPSPDWIVGVSGLELCLTNCSWVETKELYLYPWDAGVDSGMSYESPDSPTLPQEPIRRISTTSPADPMAPFFKPGGGPMAPLARLVIQKLRDYKKSCSSAPGDSPESELDLYSADAESTIRGCELTGWSGWSDCSVTCGKGLSSRRRDYLDPVSAQRNGCNAQLLQKEMCTADTLVCSGETNFYQSAPVDWIPDDMCASTEWSDWSECSANCGSGFRVRTRRFYNRLGRKQCPHVETIMKEECDTDRVCQPNEVEVITPGCEVTSWSLWSPCSVSCGNGIKVRTRLYRVTREQQLAAGCSLQLMEKGTCSGETDGCVWRDATAICHQKKEPGPCRGNFQRWYYDAESETCHQFSFGGCRGNSNNFLQLEDCEKLCSHHKSDVADDPSVYQHPEEDDDSYSNNDDEPINDDFRLALDVLAKQRREKEADGMNVVFQEIEEQRKVVDELEKEKERAGRSTWKREGELLAAQKKLMMMEKQVMMKKQMEMFQMKQNMMKQTQGAVNSGLSGHHNSSAVQQECQVTAWSPWSVQCSATCGRGFRQRFRSVSRPGTSCTKKLDKKKKCRLPPCPEECRLEPWGAWGACSASCGSSGSQSRYRQVISGSTSCGGTTEKRICLLNCCPGDPTC